MIADIAKALGFSAMKRVADWRGFDMVRRTDKPADPARFVLQREVDLVIDVGAHEGQFARSMRAAGYAGRIVSFEPVKHLYRNLVAQVDVNWQVLNCAVGEEAGEARINVARSTDYSSFRPTNSTGMAFDPDMEVLATELVQVVRLDDVTELGAAQRPFLKVDTQGFEEPVLRGAQGLLGQVEGVLLELPLVHIYDDVWSFEEAIRFMGELGFEAAQFHPVSFCHDDPVSLLEVDCLFRRRAAPGKAL